MRAWKSTAPTPYASLSIAPSSSVGLAARAVRTCSYKLVSGESPTRALERRPDAHRRLPSPQPCASILSALGSRGASALLAGELGRVDLVEYAGPLGAVGEAAAGDVDAAVEDR